MTTIAQFRTKVLAILDDASNTKFSNNQVDQALRDALKDYSHAFPSNALILSTVTVWTALCCRLTSSLCRS